MLDACYGILITIFQYTFRKMLQVCPKRKFSKSATSTKLRSVRSWQCADTTTLQVPVSSWSWQFGFPYCIDLSKGSHAHMNPGETSSVDLANRGEVDAFINIGTDAGAHFPIRAFEKLGSHIPMVTIEPERQHGSNRLRRAHPGRNRWC